MKTLKRNSIQIKMLLFFGVLTLVLFITIGFIFFRSTELAVNTAKENEFLILSQETSNKIERFLFERYGDIQVMASSPLIKDSEININLKQKYIENVRLAYKTYDYILITDNSGNIKTSTGNYKQDKSYLKCLPCINSGNIYVSDFTYSSVFNGYGVYFAAPVRDEKAKVIGAVIERMNFNSIDEIVQNVKLGKRGYAYLAQENGNTIYFPLNSKVPSLNLDGQKSKVLYPMHKDEKYILACNIISNYNTQKNKWYVIIEEPVSEAFQVILNIRNYTLIIIFIAIVLMLIFAGVMSKKITNPIKKLLIETQNIAQGNITKNIEVMSGDEIGSLAESFNKIISNLKDMMQQVLEISGEAVLLNEVRQYAEKFFDEVPSAIIIIDNAGKITNFNSVASSITGIKQNNILNHNIFELDNPIIEPIIELLKNGLNNGIIYIKHVVKIKNETNNELPIVLNTSIQKDNSNKIIGVICVFKSMEEIKAFEESVIRAKNLESLGALSAGMAHEIRNPLTSIKGFAQYLKMETKDNKNISDDATIIMSEVDRLNDIIDRFLIFARPQELRYDTININDIIENVISLISKETEKYNIEVIKKLGDLPQISVDINQIEQVILNLSLNAIQAMPQGGTVTYTTEYLRIAHVVQISIEDTGGGIKPEDYDKIFEPFYTTKQKGTGLGLAICSRIIENHKGIIQVSSTVGTGTRFIIKLPENKIN